MSADLDQGFSLGDWRVYPLRNLLVGGSGEVRVEPKVMQVLARLAAAEGEVVERDTLLRDVWGERAVSDEPLTRCVATLRRVLGDASSDPRYIQTIPKRGYRLVCPVEPLSSEETAVAGGPKRRRVLVAALSVLAAATAILLVYLFVSEPAATPPQIAVEGAIASAPPTRSIAVLPFANLSPDPENEYLSDGLASEILNRLARIPDLKVAARTSAFSFKGEDRDATEVARKLRVAYLLTGSVRQSGDKLRISAQLVDGKDGYHVWSETWEQDFADIFDIQDAITQSVIASLRIELLDNDLAVERADPAAYALYLEALEMRREPVLDDEPAIQFQPVIAKLQHALAIDPNYAPAWSALGGTQASMSEWISDRDVTDPVYASARAAAERALALDPDDVRAFRTLAAIAMLNDWDFVSAARWLAKALAIAPQDPAVRRAVGYLYSRIRPGEPPDFLSDDLERDPLNAGARLNETFGYLQRGDFDRAKERLSEATRLSPDARRVQAAESLIAYLEGDYETAAETALDRSARLCALYRLGRVEDADRELDALLASDSIPGRDAAAAYVCRGDKESAFEILFEALEARDPGLETIRGYWFFDPLKDDPRWQALLEAMGISDEHAEQIDRIFETALFEH